MPVIGQMSIPGLSGNLVHACMMMFAGADYAENAGFLLSLPLSGLCRILHSSFHLARKDVFMKGGMKGR